jgi:glucans biosynthesis protein
MNQGMVRLMNQETVRRLSNLRAAPRCGARNRAGEPCRCPAIRGRSRCRLHGGLSPGAPEGNANGNFKTGYWTAEAVEERRWVKEMAKLYAKATGK